MLNMEVLSEIGELVIPYQIKYPNIKEENVLRDIAIFTKYKEMCKKNPISIQDAKNLEISRRFKEGFLLERGVTYFDLLHDLKNYEMLKYSSILTSSSDAYSGRYLLPICTINGDVISHMGYDRTNPRGKYEVPRLSWIHQLRLLGNLESLGMYDGKEIYITEGFFDAYRINEVLGKKSIATLGARKSKSNRSIYDYLKRKGHRLIYVPDHNPAGIQAISNYDWDEVLTYPYEHSDYDRMIFDEREEEFKDKEFIREHELKF